MKNFRKKGNVIDYLNSTGTTIASGDFVVIGIVGGFAQTNIANGDTGAVLLEGVFEVPKAAGAITQGAKLYWDATAKNWTTTAASNVSYCFAFNAALSGDATVYINLTNGI